MREPSRAPGSRHHGAICGPRFPWAVVVMLSTGLAGLATYGLRDRAITPADAAIDQQASRTSSLRADDFAAPRLVAPRVDVAHLLGPAPAAVSAGRFSGGEARAEPAPQMEVASLPNPTLIDPPEAPALVQPAPMPMARPNDPTPDGPDTTIVAPLPMRRPAEAPAATAPERPRIAARRGGETAAAAPAAQPDNRNFFERLFGGRREANGPELAYAPADGGTAAGSAASGGSFGARLGLGFPGLAAPKPPMGVAIYDIGSRMVYLPNGEQLEAQSGLGEMRNDVRYAHVRMRGPTPPHTYNLVEREALFHGVRAIRLNPVGGSQAIHGRAGLLAHTYLLGPSGDSNGCISIKDYNRFLQAYLRGEIRQLIVVPTRSEAVQAVARATTRMAQR